MTPDPHGGSADDDGRPGSLATMAALMADPVRAAILLHLADGSRRPAGELAALAGASPQAASAHLARLVDGGLLAAERLGRHRFFRIACGETAEMIEAFTNWAEHPRRGRRPDPALCRARLCYDHLAGRLGVALFDRIVAQGWVALGPDGPEPTADGLAWCRHHAIRCAPPPPSHRPVVRLCLDWTERRHHLGGHLGAAITQFMLNSGYLRRISGQRGIAITPPGHAFLQRELAIDLTA